MQTDTTTQSNPEESPAEPPPTGVASTAQLELCIINQETGYKSSGITLTDEGVVIREDMSYEEWLEGLRGFKWMQSKLKLGFAGYIAFGKAHFGDKVVDASIAQLEFDMPTVKTAIEINSVPPEIRHNNLDAEHYGVLARAGLTKAKLKKWSDTASAQNLTPNQLKASIAAGEVVTTATARNLTTGIISVNGIRQEFETWLNRVKGVGGILAMEPAAIEDIKRELEPMHALYVALTVTRKAPKRKPAKAKKGGGRRGMIK